LRVTETAAAAAAKVTAALGLAPSDKATAKAPLKASLHGERRYELGFAAGLQKKRALSAEFEDDSPGPHILQGPRRLPRIERRLQAQQHAGFRLIGRQPVDKPKKVGRKRPRRRGI
jgi:hypothetical protein